MADLRAGVVDAYALTLHNGLARAHGMKGEAVAQVALLEKAWRESPETMQYNLHARAALPHLVKTAPPVVREDARRLAVEIGVPV
ncbi:hypothetical protein [Streptomyces sp. CC53]|uniref:hypothetical protein n=1 Tax=Streptomyces sp. CC53 TaxID=1906740 RepID=UPI0015A67991|nr:hypothetical protein [Streptomyces sp. CC53]